MTGFCPSLNPLRCGSSVLLLCQVSPTDVEFFGRFEVVFGEDDTVDDVGDNEGV